MQDFANRVGAPPALQTPWGGGAGALQYRVITPSPYVPPPTPLLHGFVRSPGQRRRQG